MGDFWITLQKIFYAVPFFSVIVGFILLSRIVFDKTTSFSFDDELTERDNPAFGIAFAGYMIGLVIALGGTTYGVGGDSVGESFLSLGVYGLLSVVLLRLSVWVNDKSILYKFSIQKEITTDRNCGTAFVVAGSSIATGLIIAGALTGDSLSWGHGIVDLLVYWAIGQVMLVLGGFVFQKITSYDVHDVIENDDNLAAGLSFGGFLVGCGIIMKTALVGAGSNIVAELIPTVSIAAVGMLLLVSMRVIADKLFLPSEKLSKEIAIDKNPAAGAVAAATFVALSWAFSVAVAI